MRDGRALLRCATAGLVVLLAAACGQQEDGADPQETSASVSSSDSPSGSASEEASSDVPVADPDHAVDPPPPLTERLWSADILVESDEELTDEMVEQIGRLDGVEHTEELSVGKVPIENRVYKVAVVDPASYRRFSQEQIAREDEVWTRVAGGELAVAEKLGKKLQDDQGYIRLGNEESAERVHIGAYAEQVPTVDVVLNEPWGEDIGIRPDNALLVSTGITAPDVVRKRIKEIVGDSASIQSLDVAARLGLDPDAKQTAYLTGGSVADAVGSFTYRVLGGGRIQPDQAWVEENIRTEQVPILGSVTCHKVVLPQLRAALDEVVERGLTDKIHPDEYAGCYYPRFIAGSTKLSLHSFGIALDLNVPGNGRGTAGEIDRTVVDIFKKWGFAWGGDWNYTDPMHFEMNALVEPR